MPSDGEVQTLAPLTNELIAQVLSARGYNFGTDDDGDIGGMWDDNLIWFFRRGSQGEMLQVPTLAAAEFTVDDVPRLYAFCNEWNHDRLWPKAFVHVNDDGCPRLRRGHHRPRTGVSRPARPAHRLRRLDRLRPGRGGGGTHPVGECWPKGMAPTDGARANGGTA